MDRDDLERLRDLHQRVIAPEPAAPPALSWAREAFERLEAPTAEMPSALGAAAWARATAERVDAPASVTPAPPTTGSRLALVASILGTGLAAAAALLLILGRPTPTPPPTTAVASLPRSAADVPRLDPSEPASDPTPTVRLRADGLELRSGAVRLVLLDPTDR